MHFKRAMSRYVTVIGAYADKTPQYAIGEFVIFLGEVFIVISCNTFYSGNTFRVFNKDISCEPIVVCVDALKPCPIDKKVLAEIVKEEKYTPDSYSSTYRCEHTAWRQGEPIDMY